MIDLIKLIMSLIANYLKSSDKNQTIIELKDSIREVTKYRNLVYIEIPSIYKSKGVYVNLPRRMAMFTSKTGDAIKRVESRVLSEGGLLRLSDGLRSTEMQLQAHLDWKSGKKKAYSPPPGSSGHEAGISNDFDHLEIDKTLPGGYQRFWDIAHEEGFSFIIPEPDKNLKEAWHLNYFDEGLMKLKEVVGYKEMILHAIRRIGGNPDSNLLDDDIQMMQGLLAITGYQVGDLDGIVGQRTYTSIAKFISDYDSKSIKLSEEHNRLHLLISNLGFDTI